MFLFLLESVHFQYSNIEEEEEEEEEENTTTPASCTITIYYYHRVHVVDTSLSVNHSMYYVLSQWQC